VTIPGTWSDRRHDGYSVLFLLAGRSFRRSLPTDRIESGPGGDFRFQTEVGIITCERLTNTAVSGAAAFVPDPRALENLSVLFPESEALEAAMMFATADVSLEFAAITRAAIAGIGPEAVAGLVVMGISGEFVRSMGALLQDISPHGMFTLYEDQVEPLFISALKDVGVRDLSWRSVVEIRKANVPIELLEELASLGYSSIFADELVMLHQAGVDADYLRSKTARGAALPSLRYLALRANTKRKDPEDR
jgi:hypothetical protein